MIIRARPKYINNVNNITDDFNVRVNEFYFNSGRAALKFYLQYLSKKNNKILSVGMQSFNCNVIADATLEADCQIYLLDIKLSDFSVSVESVEKIASKIDVLLLTHYQGIPNIDYFLIIELCRLKKILVIEDMAQTFGSSINDIKVGTLGVASISSFAFDKPFSSFYGGQLRLNNIHSKDLKEISTLFLNLKEEGDVVTNLDLKLLSFFYKYSNEKYYKKNIDNYLLVKLLIQLNLSDDTIYKLMCLFNNRIVNKIVNKLSTLSLKEQGIKIKRLNSKKINLLKYQEENYDYQSKKTSFIEGLCKKNNIKYLNNKNLEIHWNRYSILDKQGVLKNTLTKMNIQVGNFNWGVTLDKLYINNKKVHASEDLINSNFASQNIINIPIWSDSNYK
jgi:hypothetical protein